jgi:hypothetical protein
LNGTITVTHNPVTQWEYYSHTFLPSAEPGVAGFFDFSKTDRAESGYLASGFRVYEDYTFLSDFVENGLGREVKVYSPDGFQIWEGYIHEMTYIAGRVNYRVSLYGMANAVWTRFRNRGVSTDTEKSPVQLDTNSIARYGRKEFVISAGELESTDIGTQAAQKHLRLHSQPIPAPVDLFPEQPMMAYPYIDVSCKGWYSTLWWATYNQTASTDSQSADAQISTIVTDTNVGQFVRDTSLDTNATQVSKEYNADRKGGDIVESIVGLGDPYYNRWIAYITNQRTFIYKAAATP